MGYLHISNLYRPEAQILLNFKRLYALEKVHGTSAHVAWRDGKVHYHAGGESHICAARDHAEALELTGIGIDADDEVTVKRLSKTCELASIEIVDEDGGKSTYAQEILGAEKDGRGRLISSTAW